MYRSNVIVQVKLGRYNEFVAAFERLNELAVRKGLAPTTLMAREVGIGNQLMMTNDFETLADWDNDNTRFFGDPDCTAIWRGMGEYLEGTISTELWSTASAIA